MYLLLFNIQNSHCCSGPRKQLCLQILGLSFKQAYHPFSITSEIRFIPSILVLKLIDRILVTFETRKPYICSMCFNAFDNYPQLMSHKNHLHNRQGYYGCTECSMTFHSNAARDEHYWRRH